MLDKMSIPAFAPLPPANIRLSLGHQEWEACLDAWLTLAELTLRLPLDKFSIAASDDGSLPVFLGSFYQELSEVNSNGFNTPKALALRKVCFRLVARAWLEDVTVSQSLLAWNFLSNFCHAHLKSSALPQIMAKLWRKRFGVLIPALQKQKDLAVIILESNKMDGATVLLPQLGSITHASADIGSFFMTGSDFLDACIGTYGRASSDAEKKALSTSVYLCLASLAKTDVQSTSLLSDHLYTLKAQADKSGPSLLADIVTNTPLLSKLRLLVGTKAADRLFKLLDTLDTYRSPSLARRKKHPQRKPNNGKGRQSEAQNPINIHRMSLVTQIQDLFPDLGSGFLMKLLDEYNDDVEQVTAHLLEDSLPPHLASLDRTETAPIHTTDPQTQIDHLAPHSTPPRSQSPFLPNRHNVFDNDELDSSTSNLHIGKKPSRPSFPSNKAAILSALAAFDRDDDERDDTYDVEDVGGTVDTAHPDGEPGPNLKLSQSEVDATLFAAYKANPELFGRTFNIRRSQARMAMKAETGMTDEAIEGWAIMLTREPGRLKRLEAKAGAAAFDGKQAELAGTAYREGTETEDSDAGSGGGR
ncbi:CUE domain-containing protein, partial [Zymoseptoria brevis]